MQSSKHSTSTRIKEPWRKSMPSTSVRESERMMSGALQDYRYMDNWIQVEEKLVWPTCYPDYQPPILRLMNLETLIEDATEENYCGPAQSENVNRPSCPLNIHDAFEVGLSLNRIMVPSESFHQMTKNHSSESSLSRVSNWLNCRWST